MTQARIKKIVYLTILLLFINSGLSAAASTFAISHGNLEGDSQRILLCTTQGFKWVLLSDLNIDLNTDDADSSTDHYSPSLVQHCPFCQCSASAIDDTLSNTALSLSLNPSYSTSYRIDLVDSFLLQHNRLSHLPSRAPPTSI